MKMTHGKKISARIPSTHASLVGADMTRADIARRIDAAIRRAVLAERRACIASLRKRLVPASANRAADRIITDEAIARDAKKGKK